MDVLEKTKENLAPGQRTEGELSRKEQLALYQQRKVLMQQKGANKPNHNAGLTKPKNAQGLRDKLQGLQAQASSKDTPGKSFKFSNVNHQKVLQAGEKAVAPGTPLHSIKKRLLLTPALDSHDLKKSNDGYAAKRASTPNQLRVTTPHQFRSSTPKQLAAHRNTEKHTPGPHDVVPVRSRFMDSMKPSAQKSLMKPSRPPSPSMRAPSPMRTLPPQAAGPKAPANYPVKKPTVGMEEILMAKMEEASKLAQMGFVNGARTLLTGLIKDSRTVGVKEKALYWIGRARLEEEQKDYDCAERLLEQGLRQVKSRVERSVLEAAMGELSQRIKDMAVKEMDQLLDDGTRSPPPCVPSQGSCDVELGGSSPPMIEESRPVRTEDERLDYGRIGRALSSHMEALGSKSPAPRKSEGRSAAIEGKVVVPCRGDGNFRTGKVAKIREMFEKKKAEENAIQRKKGVQEVQGTPQREVESASTNVAGGALPDNAAAYTSPEAGLLNKYLFDNDTTPVAVRSASGKALRMSTTPIHMTLTKSPVQETPPSKPPTQQPLAKAPPVVSKSPYIESFLNDDDDDLDDGELIARLTAFDANFGTNQTTNNKVQACPAPERLMLPPPPRAGQAGTGQRKGTPMPKLKTGRSEISSAEKGKKLFDEGEEGEKKNVAGLYTTEVVIEKKSGERVTTPVKRSRRLSMKGTGTPSPIRREIERMLDA